IGIHTALARPRVLRPLTEVAHFDLRVARLLLVAATVVLIVPFILGAIRIARALGVARAAEALPGPAGGARELDLAAAPRRALLVTLQIAILLVVGVPVVALTQPFMPGLPGMAILLAGGGAPVLPPSRPAPT